MSKSKASSDQLFLDAIRQAEALALAPSASDQVRLIYADWLEEHGDPRGELMRLQHALTRSAEVANRAELEARQQRLLDAGVAPVNVTTKNSLGMNLLLIPRGEFWMGSPNAEELRGDDEQLRRVTINGAFFLSECVVTQSQYERLIGIDPSYHRRLPYHSGRLADERPTGWAQFPAWNIRWYDAIEFCNRLSELEGLQPCYELENVVWHQGEIHNFTTHLRDANGYRLPSEAEWEYACRAGTTTPFHFGSQCSARHANVNPEDPYGMAQFESIERVEMKAKKFRPNAFGLYDMHGLVFEWCIARTETDEAQSQTLGIDKSWTVPAEACLLRGGAYYMFACFCRSASRLLGDRDRRGTYGIRLAKSAR